MYAQHDLKQLQTDKSSRLTCPTRWNIHSKGFLKVFRVGREEKTIKASKFWAQ